MARNLLALGLALGGLLLLVGCTRRPAGPPLVVTAKRDGEGCYVAVNGARVASEHLLEVALAWPSRRALVLLGDDTPYKCIGGVIFTLQRAGFTRIKTKPSLPPS